MSGTCEADLDRSSWKLDLDRPSLELDLDRSAWALDGYSSSGVDKAVRDRWTIPDILIEACPYRKAVDAERKRLNKTKQSAWVVTEILLERAYEEELEDASKRSKRKKQR